MESTNDELIDVPRGLKGVVVAQTALGNVRGLEGFFHYRQYSAVDLAERRSLEDVFELALDGRLPNSEPTGGEPTTTFGAELAAGRHLPPQLLEALPAVVASMGTCADVVPLDILRTALSMLGTACCMRPSYDLNPQQRRRDALRIAASVPTLVAAINRLQRGLAPLAPRDDLGHAAAYLTMLTGVEPSPEQARALEQYLILTVDHGFNASTFTARVIASTGADVAACVVGALGALSGPLHGGAPSRALDTLDEIGSADRIDAWVRERVVTGERIMGFGHPVYRTEDPRSRMLHDVAVALVARDAKTGRTQSGRLLRLAEEVESGVLHILAELKPGRELHTNVEFYAGVVMELCGLPRHMFTPTFAVARTMGWVANVLEQAADAKIIRPSARYVGPAAPVPVPVVGMTASKVGTAPRPTTT